MKIEGKDSYTEKPDVNGVDVVLDDDVRLGVKGADVVSASALTLGADGNYFDITGNTTITSIVTVGVGRTVKLHFDGILTLTHHATNLILPSGANITTQVGDEVEFVEYATGQWRCTNYTRADGTSIVGGGGGLNDIVDDTSPQLGGSLDTNSHAVNLSKGADVVSASALNLGADGNYFDITGTTTITSINTEGIGTQVTLHFDAVLTLTHHATDLILPTGKNITTEVGDEASFVEYATGDWRCIYYTRASGKALQSSEVNEILGTETGNAFAVGDSIFDNAGTWTKAQSNAEGTVGDYIVTRLVDANDFYYANNGKFTWTSHGKPLNTHHYVSPTTAGASTTTKPSAPNYINPSYKPLDVNTVLITIHNTPILDGALEDQVIEWDAGEFDYPTDIDPAPLEIDYVNGGLAYMRYDDTTDEAVSGKFELMSDVSGNVTFDIKGFAETYGAGGLNVKYAIKTWATTAGGTLKPTPTTTVLGTFPTAGGAQDNEEHFTASIALATLGIAAGETVRFQLIKQNAGVATPLVDDFFLTRLKLSVGRV
jgi:hypothetical protein